MHNLPYNDRYRVIATVFTMMGMMGRVVATLPCGDCVSTVPVMLLYIYH